MEGSLTELSRYRFERACEDLEDARLLLQAKRYKSSVNRSYYAIFHMMRSVTALDGFDSSKHSGVIAYINRMYVKEGTFDKALSKMLDTAYRLRERADYKDFELISKEMAEEQLQKAERIMAIILPYLTARWQTV